MRTSCSHCHTQFQVPEKTLGKQAKCKSCGKMFVIVPAPASAGDETKASAKSAAPRKRQPTDRRSQPPPAPEPVDPLDDLADAAVDSGAHLRPVHGSSRSSRYDDGYDDDRYARKRMAHGASLSMTTGITGMVLAVGGVFSVTLAMVQADNQSMLMTAGAIGIGLLVFAAVLGMLAVANGTSATKKIRRARHPLSGRSQASTGIILGWVTLLLVLLVASGTGIWLSQHGGIEFKKHVDHQGNPISDQPETLPPVENNPNAASIREDEPSGNQPTPTPAVPVNEEGLEAAGDALKTLGIVFSIVGLIVFAFWLWMLIDCCTKTFPDSSNKIIWVIIIVFLGVLGALIYLIAGRPKPAPKRRGATSAH